MSENTKIQWATHTFNPWEGCTKVSPGCANCYADARAQRFGQVKWGKGQPRRRTSKANWNLPVKWNREEGAKMVGHAEFVANERPRVFCASLSDWLDDEVPAAWLFDLMTLIHKTPNLDWLLLTKRPENFRARMKAAAASCTVDPLDITDRIYAWLEGTRIPLNVWLGTSVENQDAAVERIPKLLAIPAKVRFLSCEPLLGPVKNAFLLRDDGFTGIMPSKTEIDWVIIGGESGPNARLCYVDWVRSLVSQCKAAGVAPFVKQLGARPYNRYPKHIWAIHSPLGLTDPKGGDIAEWPVDLRVREFPC